MTDRLKQILNNVHRYNGDDLANAILGLDKDIVYDALVIASSYSPNKILKDESFSVTELASQSYCTGFLVEKDNLKIAWIKTAAGGCNMLDYLLICGELDFKRLIFAGAVGALKNEFNIGDICTPIYSIAGTLANTYLKESIHDYVPFEKIYPDMNYISKIIELAKDNNYSIKEASVFCTDSIVMEYTHLGEIKAFDTDLIEMETSSFYAIAKLMEVPAVALLVVSDNSSTGVPIIGKSEEEYKWYNYSRCVVIPDMICKIAKMNL